MCRVLPASASGFDAWRQRLPGKRIRGDERLFGLIRTSLQASGRTYGSPRVHDDPRGWGERCSKERAARLMRQAQLRARPEHRRYRSACADLFDHIERNYKPRQRHSKLGN